VSDDDDTRTRYLAGDANGSLPARERADLDELRDLLASPAIWVKPPATLEADTVAAVVRAAQLGPLASSARQQRRRPARSVPAVAVTLVVALVAILIVLGVGGKRTGAQRATMVVSGTALAPGARGTANFTRAASGWEIHLAVAGLPHIAGRRYYEGWLQDASGERVTVGTFNDARNVTLWVGVSPARFTTLVVTVQRTGVDLGESVGRVLVGSLGTRRHGRP